MGRNRYRWQLRQEIARDVREGRPTDQLYRERGEALMAQWEEVDEEA